MTPTKSPIPAVLVVVLLAVAGCATAPSKSPEEQIRETIAKFIAAVQQQDVDGCMALFSEQFTNYRPGQAVSG